MAATMNTLMSPFAASLARIAHEAGRLILTHLGPDMLARATDVEAECAYGGLTLGTDGNFYGTTYWSVSPSGQPEYATGTIFKMTARGIVTILHQFTGGSDGATPYAPHDASDQACSPSDASSTR